MNGRIAKPWWVLCACLQVVIAAGCQQLPVRELPEEIVPQAAVPVARELDMVTFPDYTVGPPDILLIDAARLVPKGPVIIKPLDVVQASVSGTVLGQEINGVFQVQANGTLLLGPGYDPIDVAGLTFQEARRSLVRHMREKLQYSNAEISLSAFNAASLIPIQGQHIIAADGYVYIPGYGKVYVAGMTLREVTEAIKEKLSEKVDKPEISVAVQAYNSKVYYIVMEGAGFGDQVFRLPATGNEHVLDALANIQGFTRVSSTNIHIARPAPDGIGGSQILPVNYDAITKYARTETNYQILPGDRLFVAEDKFTALDTLISKITQPLERVFGSALLGTQTIQTINRFPAGLRSR